MDMYISLSKEIIKHPFATCPGSILAVFALALIHTKGDIFIKLKPHCEAFQPMHRIKHIFVIKTCKMSRLVLLRPDINELA